MYPVIFDTLRHQSIKALPEEQVRQWLLQYLICDRHVPHSRIAVEKEFVFNKRKYRFDALIYAEDLTPLMLIECKAAHKKITSQAIDQIVKYNMYWKVPYLLLSNGNETFCIKIHNNRPIFLDNIPYYHDL